MSSRIKTWSSKHLSFAARVQLVNAVLMSIQVYWAQVMVLPKHVLKKMNNICRAFLWFGKVDCSNPGYISWDQVCRKKKEGGLGMRNTELWNMAALGKHVWAIATNQNNLWVKWVKAVYLKQQNWIDYKPGQNSSWYWRKICGIKDKMLSVLDPALWRQGGKYSIGKCYEALRQQHQRRRWDTIAWNRLAVPKHQFVAWLAFNERLKTRDRLCRFGWCQEKGCMLCGDKDESHLHLFCQCSYSQSCWDQVHSCLAYGPKFHNLPQIVRDIRRHKMSKFRRNVYCSSILATIYFIWKARNAALWSNIVPTPEDTVKQILFVVKNRAVAVNSKYMTESDRIWILDLNV